MKTKLAILISGNGSNLQAIIDNIEHYNLPAEIVCVVSNKENVYGLERAKKHNLKTEILKATDFSTRQAYDEALNELLSLYNPDLICLAGFMRILTTKFIDRWPNKIINIHPSLLPAFKGINAQQQAYNAGVKITGCTVHFVNAELDAGPIIMQKAVALNEQDNLASIASKILELEHICYPEVIKLFAQQKVQLIENKVKILS